MKPSLLLPRPLISTIALTLALASASEAAVTLTIDEFTTTRFTVSVSGTLAVAADTAPIAGPGGNPSMWISPSLFAIVLNQSASMPFYTGSPTLVSNTLGMSVFPTNTFISAASSGYFGIFFSSDQTMPLSAGAELRGSATFTGDFNPAAAALGDFQLWSGYDQFNPQLGLSVFHTNAVPEPTTLSLLAICGSFCLFSRRRREI